MINKFIWAGLTIGAISLINGIVAHFLHAAFIDYAFLTAVVVTAIIGFFHSSGGFSSNQVRMTTQAKTGIKLDAEKQSFHPSVVFYTAIGYTAIAGVVTLFYYKDYFFS